MTPTSVLQAQPFLSPEKTGPFVECESTLPR